MGILSYMLLSEALPATCQMIEQHNIDNQVESLNQIVEKLTFSEATDELKRFATKNNIIMRIYKGNEQLVEYNNTSDRVLSSSSAMYTLNTLSGKYQLNIYHKHLSSVEIINLAIKEMLPGFLIVNFILSSIFSSIIAVIITKPINSIRNTARKIATFDFDIDPPLERQDELGQLSKDVYGLSKKLDNRLQQLEKENALEQKQRLFFAAASHELKTPLTIIKNKLEGMLYQYGEYKDYEIYLPSTLETVLHMERMINEILITSQLNHGSPVKTRINLAELVHKTLMYYQEIIEAKAMQMVLEIESVTIEADIKMIEKVLTNIIGNAIKYSGSGEKIIIQLNQKAFSVENFGVHLTEQQIDALCDPFYRAEQSRNKATGGTGLGLYLVKEILDRHELDFKIIRRKDSLVVQIDL